LPWWKIANIAEGGKTMRIRTALGTLVAAALGLLLGANAEAQLAKQGTYTSHFGWYAIGKTYELEKGHTLFQGEYSGTNFNDAGTGFLHNTSVVCPGIAALVEGGRGEGHGSCIITDQDGDKAFLVWKCKNPGTGCQGDFQWKGGTGKYTGITGNNTFTGFSIGATSSGYSVWKGEWKLP
jgi:hypothetical protein